LLYDHAIVEEEVLVVEFRLGRRDQDRLLGDLVPVALEQVRVACLSSSTMTEACGLAYLLPSLFAVTELLPPVDQLGLLFVPPYELLLPGLADVRLDVVVQAMSAWKAVGNLC
jgi:hypothetical protein